MTKIVYGSNVKMTIDGHDFSVSDDEYFCDDDTQIASDRVEFIPFNHAPLSASLSASFTVELDVDRSAQFMEFARAICELPRAKTWTVMSNEMSGSKQHGFVTAWTDKGVRRKLRKLMHGTALQKLYAVDFLNGRLVQDASSIAPVIYDIDTIVVERRPVQVRRHRFRRIG